MAGTAAGRRCPALSLLGHQLGPGAPQGELNPDQRGGENIELPRFHLLHVAGVDFSEFGQLFLGQFPGATFPANVRAQDLQSRLFFLA